MVAMHPGPDVLADFALGRLPEASAVAVAGHLAGCDPCQARVAAVPEDPVLARLRSLPDLPDERPQACGDPWVPAELLDHPRYRLLDWLGAGGMGVVFKAEHRLMGRPVALKVISRRLTADPAAVRRFRREVRAAARLDHPNIVRAYDAEQAGELHFLVTEYVEGEDLARHVAGRGPLPVAAACGYAAQAAAGLQHASEAGLVHRDVKPQNLLLTPQGRVKVLDFGLAGFAADNGPPGSLTEYGQVLGTPDYCSPEQLGDARQADARSDVYSLGCTLYFLLTGGPPFPDGSPLQKIAAHLGQHPRPLSEVRTDVPEAVARVVARMLAKDPADRFQTPAEVREALDAAVGPAVPGRGRRAAWLAAAAAGLAVAGTALHLLGSRHDGSGAAVVRPDREGAETKPRSKTPAHPSDAPPTAPAAEAGTPTDEAPSPRKKIDAKRVSSDEGKAFID